MSKCPSATRGVCRPGTLEKMSKCPSAMRGVCKSLAKKKKSGALCGVEEQRRDKVEQYRYLPRNVIKKVMKKVMKKVLKRVEQRKGWQCNQHKHQTQAPNAQSLPSYHQGSKKPQVLRKG